MQLSNWTESVGVSRDDLEGSLRDLWIALTMWLPPIRSFLSWSTKTVCLQYHVLEVVLLPAESSMNGVYRVFSWPKNVAAQKQTGLLHQWLLRGAGWDPGCLMPLFILVQAFSFNKHYTVRLLGLDLTRNLLHVWRCMYCRVQLFKCGAHYKSAMLTELYIIAVLHSYLLKMG